MKLVLISILQFLALSILAQEPELKKFLSALKTPEFEESQIDIKKYSFNGCSIYTITSYESFSGTTFQTDTKGIIGYKTIFQCKALNKAGALIEKRIMAVMYFDKVKKTWKVFEMREPANSCEEYKIIKEKVDAGEFYTAKQYVYRSMAYWAMMCGKISEGLAASELGDKTAKSANDDLFSSSTIDIKQIVN